MNKILISGYYGFANAGDEAMLTSIVDSLREEEPNLDITVISGNPKMTAELHQVKAIPRFDILSVMQAMAKADLLLSGGGSLLQDVTSTKSLFYYLSILALAKLMGKKVVLFAQGIGPINSSWARRLTGYICRKADLITVRDDGSLEELRAMGLSKEKIIITADAVFSLPTGQRELGQAILQKYNLGQKPLIGFALRHWKGEERFSREFAQAAALLSQKYDAQIVFIPLQFPNDETISEDVKKLMGDKAANAFVLPRSFNAQEYLAIVSNLQLLVGMRLHALVFAALNNVPFLGVSYDPKVDRFVAAMAGKVTGDIEHITALEIMQGAEELWQKKDPAHIGKISSLRLEAKRNIQRVIKLLPR
jgi:polysaccharide pyruvyl transferase CsaB